MLPLIILGLAVTSCVSGKKYTTADARAERLQQENEATHRQLNESRLYTMKLTEEKTILQKERDAVQQEYSAIQNELMILSSESNMTIRSQAQRLKNLQDIIHSQTVKSTELKDAIARALLNYSTDELIVSQRDGKVFVALEEKLLFKSGSDEVDPKGKEALKSLATVLNTSKDFSVAIEGHTDNVPIKTQRFKDNWDLSTARASSIVRILTKEYGFDAATHNSNRQGRVSAYKPQQHS